MKIGKLSYEELKELVLCRLPQPGAHVLRGPGIGLDCAAIRFNDGQVVLTSDPITGASSDLGYLAVHVSCNDIAACGIRPSVLVMVLIAPPDCEADDLSRIVDQASEAAQQLNVSIVGGHTEISEAVTRFVMITTAVGLSYGDQIIDAGGGRPGDTILMTKTAGLEGTAILAVDFKDRLQPDLSEAELEKAAAMIRQISVVEEGTIGGRLNVHAMHDATEGGVLGACWEMAEACQLGCVIEAFKIPVDPLTRKICQVFGLDPLRLISSGSLIIATDQPEPLIVELTKKGILCTAIGCLTSDRKRLLKHNDTIIELSEPGTDELYKVI
ncbi:MAG: AIR synthase family protein [Clostridia bacterium]|nr:AIR synthase family protein [Clostridia bacterium]